MMAVDFIEANVTYGKPKGMTDEQCHSIRAMKAITDDGFPIIVTVWMPSKEDIDAINAGRPVILRIVGEIMPPVSIYTYDENLQPNV